MMSGDQRQIKGSTSIISFPPSREFFLKSAKKTNDLIIADLFVNATVN